MEAMLSSLAEPNRRRIVEVLRSGPHSVNELVQELDLPQPLVSKHLRVMREAHIVHARPRGQQRVYALEPAPFRELDAWVESFRRVWEGRLDSLDEYLQEVKRKERPSKK